MVSIQATEKSRLRIVRPNKMTDTFAPVFTQLFDRNIKKTSS